MTSRGKVENMWCFNSFPSKNEHFLLYSLTRTTPHLALTFLNNYRDIPRVLCAQFLYMRRCVLHCVIPTSSCVLLSALNLHLIRPNPIQNMNTYPNLFFWGVHTTRLVFSMLYLFTTLFHTFYFYHFVIEFTYNTVSCYFLESLPCTTVRLVISPNHLPRHRILFFPDSYLRWTQPRHLFTPNNTMVYLVISPHLSGHSLDHLK